MGFTIFCAAQIDERMACPTEAYHGKANCSKFLSHPQRALGITANILPGWLINLDLILPCTIPLKPIYQNYFGNVRDWLS